MLKFGEDTEIPEELPLGLEEEFDIPTADTQLEQSGTDEELTDYEILEEEYILEEIPIEQPQLVFGGDDEELELDVIEQEIDLQEDSLDDLFDKKVNVPRTTRDLFNGKFSVDFLGLNPLVLLKEPDLELIGDLIGLYKKERAGKFVREMKIFANHVANIIEQDYNKHTNEYITVYETLSIRIKELDKMVGEALFLDSAIKLSNSSLRTQFEMAAMDEQFNKDKLAQVLKTIRLMHGNPLTDSTSGGQAIQINMMEYIRRNYSYKEKERQILTELDFPDIFENESVIKELSDLESRLAHAKKEGNKAVDTSLAVQVSELEYTTYFYNCRIALDNGLDGRTYKIA